METPTPSSSAPESPGERRRHAALLLSILAMAIVAPGVFYLGPRTADHFGYLELAQQVLQGTFHVRPHPHYIRYGFFLPLAALEALLGVNAFSSAAIPVLASVLHVLAAYIVSRTLSSREVALWTAAIVALVPFETLNATLLFPDLPVAALSWLGFALVFAESRREKPRILPLLAAGALFGWAYLVKETVVFLLVPLAAWIAKRRAWNLAWTALPVLVIGMGDAVLLGFLTGNPFYRVTISSDATAAHLLRFFYPQPRDLLARMTWGFPSILLYPLDKDFPYFAPLAFLAFAAAIALRREPFARFMSTMAVCLLLLAWIWPLKLTPFVPAVTAEARHLSFLVLPMAFLAGAGLVRIARRTRILIATGTTAFFLGSTVLVHQYLARDDAGLKAAFEFLAQQGATRLRAVDLHGNRCYLYSYLSGYSGRITVSPFANDELSLLRDEWVVVDDRGRVPGKAGRVFGKDLSIPAAWQERWTGAFPERWDPRSLLSGERSSGSYRMRVFRVP